MVFLEHEVLTVLAGIEWTNEKERCSEFYYMPT